MATDPSGAALTASREVLARAAIGQPGAPGTVFVPYGQTKVIQAGTKLALSPGLLSALPSTYSVVPEGLAFFEFTPKENTVSSLNTRGSGLSETTVPGVTRVEVRYQFVDVELVSADLSGSPVSGPEFDLGLKVLGTSPPRAGFIPDTVFGPYRILLNQFVPDNDQGIDVFFDVGLNGVLLSSHTPVNLPQGFTYSFLASGGAAAPPSAPSPGLKIQVQYDALAVQILATDSQGNPLAADRQPLARVAIGKPAAPSTDFVSYGSTVAMQTGVDMILTPGLVSTLPDTYTKVPAGADF